MKDAGRESDYLRWLEFARRNTGDCNGCAENPPCIRISNQRYAQDATREDRLTLEDKEMLKEMGIAL
jgi:hypothetical protein